MALEIANEYLRATVLPEIGGKVSSIVHVASGAELLQQPLVPCVPRPPGLAFHDSDASGWDECLPTVAACSLRLEEAAQSSAVELADHGDLWRAAWTVLAHDTDSVRMTARASSLPLELERTMRLGTGENSGAIALEYTLRNVGSAAVPFLWSAHPLFAVDAGDRVVLPASVGHVQVEWSANGRLAPRGLRAAWPNASREIDLSTVEPPDAGVGDKLFAAAPAEGRAAIERVRRGLRVELDFDPAALPWLGIWLCYGGWPVGAAVRGYCAALEPCTAPVDSLAEAVAAGLAPMLAAGAEKRWMLGLRVTSL